MRTHAHPMAQMGVNMGGFLNRMRVVNRALFFEGKVIDQDQGPRTTAEPAADSQVLKRKFLEAGEIRLIAPGEGEVTQPLQQYPWPPVHHMGPESDTPEMGARYVALAEKDQSLPRPVQFAWEVSAAQQPLAAMQQAPTEQAMQYDLILALDPDFTERMVISGLVEPRAEVANLLVGTPYYWKVVARAAVPGRVLAESPVSYFFTNAAPPRWIHVPGISNVRDIGGWKLPGGRRVRQGMIFRGSEMNGHCTISQEGRRVMVEDLGVRTDLDLRGVGEERKPALDVRRVEYINIPIMAYESIAHPEFTGRYRALFGLLASSAVYPMYIHCWGGADRTGTVSFLILALLGVSNEDLFTDYELTSLSLWGERLRGSEAFQDLLQMLELFAPKGSGMKTQVERYLKVIGVTEEEIARIREILIEE